MEATNELTQALFRQRQGEPVWSWFDQRVRTHHASMAGLSGRRYHGKAAVQRVDSRLEETRCDRRRVLYLHVPFCRRICTFCAFFRQAAGRNVDRYAEALSGEIDAVADRPWPQARPFEAVYFGGGTPTVLPADELAGLVRRVRDRFPLTPSCEITVEARFDGTDESYLHALHAAGVNRLSFGVQTFDTRLRRRLGRIADRETILHTLDTAERAGFRSVSVDLMYNLPGQTESTWVNDLQTLASSTVSGASVYALVPFPDSALTKAMAAGSEPPLGGLDVEYALLRLADRTIRKRPGWQRMLPFHYGWTARETCTYNASRPGQIDVLGLGCGAGGELKGIGYMHEMNVGAFLDRKHTEALPVTSCVEREPCCTDRLEAFDLFSCEGIERGRLGSLVPSFIPAVEQLIALRLLADDGTRLRLTADGCFWSYNLAAMLTQSIVESGRATDRLGIRRVDQPTMTTS